MTKKFNREAVRERLRLNPNLGLQLLSILEVIVSAWDSIPETSQVPDEINVDPIWESARKAIMDAKEDT